MKNKSLALDYITRAGHRLAAVEVLMERKSYADVVRESQELIELCLKGILRMSNVEVPRLHDVGDVLKTSLEKLPPSVKRKVDFLAKVSRYMRRDRELAFYGSEDLTPSEFYREEDAVEALKNAKEVYRICSQVL